MKKLKPIPRFNNEDQEQDFWSTHNLTDYFDVSKTQRAVFPNLRSSTRSISIRLPEWLIARIKSIATKRDVPYQSLIKMLLIEKIDDSLKFHK